MYEREQNGYTVEWEPSNQTRAEQAMEDVSGTGVPDTHTLPDEANVPLESSVARDVSARYRELCHHTFTLTLDDGEVAANGGGSEPVTVELYNDGSLVTGSHTAVVDVDGHKHEVELVDGRGTLDVTTDKGAGGTVSVKAVNVVEITGDGDLTFEQSREKAINVV
jgi:hypothetical protein